MTDDPELHGTTADDIAQETSGSAGLLAALVNSSLDAIMSQTLGGTVTSWNPAATKLFGYGSGEMVGQSIRRLIPAGQQDEEDRILARIEAGERVEPYETARLHKNGDPIDVLVTVSPIWESAGKLAGVSNIVRGVTAQKRAAETRPQSEECLRQFVEDAPAAIAIFDRDMRYMACSRRWLTYHGSNDQSVLGRCHYEVFPKVSERWRELHRRGMAGETVCSEQDASRFADGEVRWVRWEMRPWLTGDRAVGGITIVAEDVTGRVEAVSALRESEMQMRLAQEAAKAGIWEWRLADGRVEWSETLWNTFGIKKPEQWELTFEGWVSHIHSEDRERVANAVLEAAAHGREYELQWRLNLPEGEPERWVLVRGSPVAGANGTPDRYIGVALDITECKRMEEALKESEERLRRFVEQAPAAIAMFDRDMRYIACSRRWLTDHKLDEASVVGRSHYEVFPEIPGRWKEAHRRSMMGEVVRAEEDAFVRADGRTQWERWEMRPWLTCDQAVGGITIMSEDVTERVEAVRALRESELRMRVAQKAAKAGTWELRLADNRSQWSESIWSLYGLKPGQCTPSFEAWASSIHPDDRGLAIKAVRDAIATSNEYEVQWRVNLPEGKPKRWLFSRGSPIADANGVPDRYIGVVIDITERKRMEEALRESEERLRFALKGARAGVWHTDVAARRIFWSEECCELHGRDPGLRWPQYEEWLACLHPDDIAQVEKANLEALIIGAPQYKVEYRVVLSSGEIRWLEATGKVDYDERGLPSRVLGIVLDATARKEAELASERAEQLERQRRQELETILAALPVAVLIAKDATCNEITGNPAAYSLLNRSPGTNLSKTAPDEQAPNNYEIYRNGLPAPVADYAIRKAVAEKRAISGQELEFRFVAGSSAFVLGNALPLLDDAGEVRGAVAAYSDITDLKRTEAALRESEERLQFALKAAGAGTWEVALDTGKFIASDRTVFLHALPLGTVMTHANALACTHPEDRPRIEAAFRRTLETGEPFRLETRVPLPDGSIRWLESCGELRSVSGRRMIGGLILDVTERKRAEEALRESEEHLRFSLKGANAAAWQWEFGAEKQVWSPESYDLHGRDPSLGAPTYGEWLHCLHPEDRAKVENVVSRLVEMRLPEYRVEYRILRPSGEVRWLDALAQIDYSADGAPLRISGINLDITERKRAEEARRNAEELERQKREELEAVLAALPVAVVIARDAACVEMSGNRAAYDLLRLAPDDDLSKSAPPEREPQNYEVFSNGRRLSADEMPIQRAALEKRAILEEELEVRFAEGGNKFVLSNALPLFDNTGKVRGAVGAFSEVTHLKRTEAALRDSEKRLQLALEAANAGTWELTLPTGELALSDRALAFLGLSPGTPMTAITALAEVHPEDRPSVEAALRKSAATGEPLQVEGRVLLPDGSVRWLESQGEVRVVSGKQVFAGLVVDITERKRAEIALRESEELLRTIMEHVPVPILLSREDRRILLINPALTALTGYTHSDIPTRQEWETYAYRERAESVREEVKKIFDKEAPSNPGEMWVHTKSGEKRLWAIRTAPAGRDASGKRLAVSVALDITDRKKSEADARAARSKLEAALSAMSDAVLITDAEGNFIHINEAFAKFHKFKSQDNSALSLPEYPALFDIYLPNGELAPLEQWPIYRALHGESVTGAEYLLHRKDTGALWAGSYNFAPIRSIDGEITGVVLTARDITDRKVNERRLRASEARLKSIIDTAADSIIVIDGKGTIQSANPATKGIFGYTPESLAGKHIGLLMPVDVRERHNRYLAGFSGPGALIEVEARRKDGSAIPLDKAVAEWRDSEGGRFFTAIFRDLTERKRNEEALANARRLEATGKLAGGVAHDFNNLLAVIAGNLELAEDRITDQTTRDLMRRALAAAEQGSGLNRRLLSLARKRTLQPQRLILNSRVEETAKLLTGALGEHIALTTDLAPGLWMTLADPGEIDSAILNIAANARDAMPSGGSIRITTLNVTLDARAAAKLHGDARPGDYVRLAIADNGGGMPQEVLDKAMEPFFTTKEAGAGTGLGLTSVASFARQTGGFATIASASGCGCVVSVYLPRVAQDQPASSAKPEPVPLGDGELVLVVEDDAQVREVTLKRIESLGYAVEEARTGPEAIKHLESGAPVRLVLSDIVMPGGMTGYDVARWVASNKPDIRVILSSGYNEGDRSVDATGAIRDVAFLEKPYSRDSLARALSEALALNGTA